MSEPVSLAHTVAGDGPALLILHGFMGDKNNWRGYARKFAENFTVVSIDARNHGESPHAGTMDYLCQAEDIRALMDKLGIAQANILGHSMGGKTAMALALLDAERVGSLLVVDIAPVRNTDRFDPLLAAMQKMDLSSVENRGDADAALGRAIRDASLRSFLLKNLIRDAAGWRWRVDLALLRECLGQIMDFPTFPDAACYDGPGLIVRGGRSEAISEAGCEKIQSLFPQSVITTIDAAGHWPHAETPEAFARVITPFLAQRCRD